MASALVGAGAAAAGAYLNAKYHFSKDISWLWWVRYAHRKVERAIVAKRLSMWYLFEETVNQMPQSPSCIWSKESTYSWREAYDTACRFAQFFLSLGIRRGQLVALNHSNSPEYLLMIFAAWSVGSACVLINHNLSGDALLHCIRLSKTKLLIVDEDSQIRQRVEAIRGKLEDELEMRIIVLDGQKKSEIMALDAKRPGDHYRDSNEEQDPAVVMFTSGSTGFPKALPIHLRRFYIANGDVYINQAMKARKGPNGDRVYVCMPMYHATAIISATACLTAGVMLAIGKRFRVSTFWDEIRASDSTSIIYVGETARYLLAAPESLRDRDHKVWTMFGNGLRPEVWYKFRDRFGIEAINEFYSSTEGMLSLVNQTRGKMQAAKHKLQAQNLTYHSPISGDFLAGAIGHHGLILRTLLHNRWVPVPISPENTKDLLRSPHTTPPNLSPGRSPYPTGGEILVRCSSTEPAISGFIGYLDDPGATSSKFARDVFAPGDLWWRSGDALRRDDDGRWYFIDRLGDTFRWKGENVATAEVGSVVGEFEGVLEANVYGVVVPGHDGRAGCAAVFLRTPTTAPKPSADDVTGGDGGNDTEAAAKGKDAIDTAVRTFDWRGLHAHLRRKLPAYAIPVFIRIVGAGDGTEIRPSMHNNKQDKKPLRDEGVEVGRIEGSGDRLMWLPPGRGDGGDGYVEFTGKEFEGVVQGRAKL
ncbi:MAG: hypothetical protein M1831_004547 [Alyxoria varia]|nr:MAG: hypothetical protein M1831_004547 [Alyxoria varia]